MKIKLTILFLLFCYILNAQQVIRLVNSRKYSEAERYCESKAFKELENTEYFNCYNELADEHFVNDNIDLAYKCYKRAHNNEGIIKVGDTYFDNKNYKTSYNCYKDAFYNDGIIKIGDVYLEKTKYEKALGFYTESDSREGVIKVGNAYFNNNNYKKAYKCYRSVSYNDGIIKIGDAFLEKEEFDNAILYYDSSNYKVGLQNVIKEILKEKQGFKVIIDANYSNVKKRKVKIPIIEQTEELLSLANFKMKDIDKDSMILKISFVGDALGVRIYDGLYCGAKVKGNLEFYFRSRIVYNLPFDFTKYNFHENVLWLDYEGQYKYPHHAPFESAFFSGFIPQLVYLLDKLYGNEFINLALKEKRNHYVKAAAIYTIGANKYMEFVPTIVKLLKNSDDWDYNYNNMSIDEVYMGLEAIRNITHGSYFEVGPHLSPDSKSEDHIYQREAFFIWWNKYLADKKVEEFHNALQ